MKLSAGDFFIILFFSIGLVLCGISYHFYRSGGNLIASGIETKGVVIGMHRMKPLEYPVAPSVKFYTQSGKVHIWHSSEGRNPPEYQIGQEVSLHYNPNNPDEVILEQGKLMVYVFGGIGMIFLLLSVWDIGGSIKNLWLWFFGRSVP